MHTRTYPWGRADEPRVDPYFEWSMLTGWNLYGTEGAPTDVPVLMEFASPGDAEAAIKELTGVNRATDFGYMGSPAQPPSRFVSAVIRADDFPRWQARPKVQRVQLMLARIQQDGSLSQRIEQAGKSAMAAPKPQAPPTLPARPAQAANNAHSSPLIAEGAEKLVIVGAIDDGCCLAHEQLYSPSGGVSVLSVWDQGLAPDGPWRKDGSLPYGSELIDEAIRCELEAWATDPSWAPCEATERTFYADRLRRPAWGDRSHKHGAGVLHVLTGRYPLPYNPTLPPTLRRDIASPHPVLFVQLARSSVLDTSGGAIGRDVLDGIRYIVQRAKQTAQRYAASDWHAVVSVSFGGLAGPHDGSSIAEQAIDELIEVHADHVSVVVAAGNGAVQGIHASRQVWKGKAGCFYVFVPPQCDRETYVEFWLRDAEDIDLETLSVVVTPPAGTQSAGVQPGSAFVFSKAEGEGPAASLLFARRVVQGLNGTMCLLAIRAEHAGVCGSIQASQSGVWQVRFESPETKDAAIDVQAWIERNDSVGPNRKPQRSKFVEDGSGYVSEDDTLSSLASGSRTLVVGAFTRSNERVTRYSGRGHTGLQSADGPKAAYAPGDDSISSPGVVVPGFFSGRWEKQSGTSIAAPRVARALAEHLSLSTRPKPVLPKPEPASVPTKPKPAAQPDRVLKPPPDITWPPGAPQALGIDG